jgi:hypothetical protein
MNSFAFLEAGVMAEAEGQSGLRDAGEAVVQRRCIVDPS